MITAHRTRSKKILSGLLMVAIFAPCLSVVSFAQRAQAQMIVNDPPATAILAGIATAAGTSAAEAVDQGLISKALAAIAWTVAKVAIQTMTKSIVNWINGGFEGSPAFETDLNNSLRKLGDGVAQGFLTQLAKDQAVHSPFIDSLVTNVGTAYYLYSGKDALREQLRYTLNKSAADDKAFLAGDFSQGGWNAWFSAFMNPANNPYGAQMIASQALATQVSAAANQRVAELGWGSGFLSWRGDCIDKGQNTGGNSGKNGSSAGAAGNVGVGVGKNTGGSTGATAAAAGNAQSLSDREKCSEYEVKTPGSVIEGTLIPNINSPLHQLELADNINEIVGALAQQLVSKVLGGGGLSGVSKPSQGGGRSTLDAASDPAQFSSTVTNLSGGFNQNVANSRAQVETFKSSWQKIADAATEAKKVCSSQSTEIQAVLDKATKAIARADTATAALDSIKDKSDLIDPEVNVEATKLTTITNSYLQLLSSGTLPSAEEYAEAARESQNTGSADPGSLYTQMTRLSNPLLCVRGGN